jgi:hypothetical protein
MQDGVDGLPHPQETQEGSVDQEALHAMQEAPQLHKSHNTCDCHRFNKDSNPIKKNGGTGESTSKEKGHKDATFVQIFSAEHLHKCKKLSDNKLESDNDSNFSS